jgi:hypothetical protein
VDNSGGVCQCVVTQDNMDNPYTTPEAQDIAILDKERVEQEILSLEVFKETDEWHWLSDMEQIHLERQHNAWAALANVLEDRIRHF